MNGFVKKPNKKKFNLKACKKNKLNYKLLKPNLIQTHLKIQKSSFLLVLGFSILMPKNQPWPNQTSSVWTGSRFGPGHIL